MAMNQQEMIEFFREQADLSVTGLDVARANANYHLAAFNCSDRFTSLLMVGLLQWRLGINPKSALIAALDAAEESLVQLRQMDASARLCNAIPYEEAMLISTLVDRDIADLDCSSLSNDRRLDLMLAKRLRGQIDDKSFSEAIEEYRSKGRPELAVATYECYGHLLSGAGEPATLLARAEELFIRRKKDRFYSGGNQTAGGGRDNDVTVDYRLGAVLKYAGIGGASIHHWQW